MEEINQKSKSNAVAAYLLLFISWLLLFNKNKYVNNPFVRNHIKSSMVIHVLILLNYIVFIFFGLFDKVNFEGFYLNIILAQVFFILIGILLVRGIYSAVNGKEQRIGDFIKLTTGINLNVNNNQVFDEKDKLTIVFSHIPFVGYIVGNLFKNENIKNVLKLNMLATVFVCLVYVFGYSSIANLFLLIYIIFICFFCVYLYGKEELISINLPDYVLPNVLINIQKDFFEYLFGYFNGNFKGFKEIQIKNSEIQMKKMEEGIAEIKTLPELKLSKFLIYIPIINFIFLSQKENNYRYHIRNGIILSFVFIVVLNLIIFDIISGRWLIMFLFPICFGIGKLQVKYYKMPYIYEMYEIFVSIKKLFKGTKKVVNENRKKVQEVSLKVGEEVKKEEKSEEIKE